MKNRDLFIICTEMKMLIVGRTVGNNHGAGDPRPDPSRTRSSIVPRGFVPRGTNKDEDQEIYITPLADWPANYISNALDNEGP